MQKIGPLPIVTELTIAEPGWYWFEPSPSQNGNSLLYLRPQFLKVSQDEIDGGCLECPARAGKYAGPIEPPDMSCQHEGPMIRYGQSHNVHKCILCGQEYSVAD